MELHFAAKLAIEHIMK